MIELNATIFVQILHFCCAWWALSTFLFKPFVRVIQEQRLHQKRLHETLQQYKNRLEKAQEQAAHEWHSFQKLFAAKIPEYTKKNVVFSSDHSRSYVEIDQIEKKRLIEVVAKDVSQRIMHD